MQNRLWTALVAVPLLAFPGAECTFLENPDDFNQPPEQHWREVSGWTDQIAAAKDMQVVRREVAAQRNNLIDEYIFARMERDGIQPAPMSDDQEFLRRVYLDLTGRIASPEQVRSFLQDTNPAKRALLIDSLIGTEEFIDKWTMFLGDLFKVDGPSVNVNRYLQGRDAFYVYLRDAVAQNMPYYRIVQDLILARGDTFTNGPVNWVVGGTAAMGPIQDTYDLQAANVAQTFLGISAVDCLLCHDGARHLDAINLWGSQQKRSDIWGLPAFFARTEMKRQVVTENPAAAKFVVSDLPAGDYLLNTLTGNRTPRVPADNEADFKVAPHYPFAGETITLGLGARFDLAVNVTADPQLARAAVNYVWEKLMVEALVSPSNGFDPARLDPDNPPPAPWTLQPTNPELLQALSQRFRDDNMDLRQLIALIVKSNTYQLSSSYPGEWRSSYVPYYARKFARRLDAEEIHDAVVQATGILPRYTLDYAGALTPFPPVNWAMKLPDAKEPRSNAQVVQFLNAFGRGDRDLTMRNSGGSILQGLNMMNNNFIMSRIHANNDGSNVQRLLALTSDPGRITEELYLSTLARFPSPPEITAASEIMAQAGVRRGAELVQWALLNKLEFLFSY